MLFSVSNIYKLNNIHVPCNDSLLGCLNNQFLQEALLSGSQTLLDTPYTYKGVVADNWLLEEDLPPSSMMPDPVAVAAIQGNPEQLQVIQRQT